MSFVYFNIQFTSFYEHAAPHEHEEWPKLNKSNLLFVWGEQQRLINPGAMV